MPGVPPRLHAGRLWAHPEQLSTLWLSSVGPLMPLLGGTADILVSLTSPSISPHFCTSAPSQSKAVLTILQEAQGAQDT